MLSLYASSSENYWDFAALEADTHGWPSLALHLTSCFLFYLERTELPPSVFTKTERKIFQKESQRHQ